MARHRSPHLRRALAAFATSLLVASGVIHLLASHASDGADGAGSGATDGSLTTAAAPDGAGPDARGWASAPLMAILIIGAMSGLVLMVSLRPKRG